MTSAERVQFSVRFSEMALATLRHGDWQNLVSDIQEFLGRREYPPDPHSGGGAKRGAQQTFQGHAPTVVISQKVSGMYVVPSRSLARANKPRLCNLQRAVRAALEAVVDRQEQKVHVKTRLSLMMSGERVVLSVRDSAASPMKETFLPVLFYALADISAKPLLRCPECDTIFFRVRKQAYCSATCRNRRSMREYLRQPGRKEERRKAARRAYERRVKEERPGAKVRIRPYRSRMSGET